MIKQTSQFVDITIVISAGSTFNISELSSISKVVAPIRGKYLYIKMGSLSKAAVPNVFCFSVNFTNDITIYDSSLTKIIVASYIFVTQ